MLTRAEHTKLTELLSKARCAEFAYGVSRIPNSGTHAHYEKLLSLANAAHQEVINYVDSIGPSKYEHPRLARQQNDGLREKQGR